MKHRLTVLLLLCVAVSSACKSRSMAPQVSDAREVTLAVSGMTCDRVCAGKVRGALESVAGVEDVRIDWDARTFTVTCSPNVDPEELKESVEAASFGAVIRK